MFYDEYAIQFFDPEHSESEDRFILLGASFKPNTLIVCHCFREEETIVRIISARKADKEEHYDFSKIKGRKNLYLKYLKQPVTMRLNCDSVDYFKSLAEETGIPYQTLINCYLRDCAINHRKLMMQ